MNYQLLTAPAGEPVLLADAKDWLKIDGTDEDKLVAALITSARLAVEAVTGLLLMPQTWRLSCDDWPSERRLRLSHAPLQSVQAFRFVDADGNAKSVPLENLAVDTTGREPWIALKTAPPERDQYVQAYQLDLLFGYANAAQVPETLKLAIKMLVAFWHENRGDDATTTAQTWPEPVALLLQPFMLRRI